MCTISKISGIVFFLIRMCYKFKEHLSHKDSLRTPKWQKKLLLLFRVLEVSIQLKLSYHLLRIFTFLLPLFKLLMRKTRISERVSDAVLTSVLWNKLNKTAQEKLRFKIPFYFKSSGVRTPANTFIFNRRAENCTEYNYETGSKACAPGLAGIKKF